MLLSGQNIKKEYGIQKVLDIKKIEIFENDRIGIVGRNGVGKSTLLGILSGNILCDEGIITRNCEIAEILQSGESKGDSEGKFISQMKIRDSAIKSGGEKTRQAIANAFSKHAPLIFADEPTTNLDIDGILTLEKMLVKYPGSVVLISHDRELLDHVCNQIWEINEGHLKIFQGNYTAWYEQRIRERDFQTFEYEQYTQEKKRLEMSISNLKQNAKKAGKPPKRMGSSEWMLYKGTASIQQGHVQKNAGALSNRLKQLEKKERPKELPNISMKLGEQQKIKSKTAAKIINLTVKYDGKAVLNHVNLSILTGKKIFLTGNNGTGKTTLIRSLVNRVNQTFITSDATVGYFSQSQENLDYGRTVLENVMATAVVPEHICRAVLMNLYMNGNDSEKKVSVLSGGERVKTAIAKVLVSGCNFLILDEPTNHLDIYTMEGLEKLLSSYNGTVLVVSHDRKFTMNIADMIYKIEEGMIQEPLEVL
ncbi:MAG: ribosomal protection-like ABC-F family protein [Lachnotalea sp.]